MKVTARVFSVLKSHTGGKGTLELDLVEGATVASAIEALGIPDGVERVVLLNGRPADLDHGLSPGDAVTVFPPVTGG